MSQETEFSFDEDMQMAVCDYLDVSNPDMWPELCAYLNKGLKIQVNQVVKKNPHFSVPYTLVGHTKLQVGKGLVISGYRARYDNYIVDIC